MSLRIFALVLVICWVFQEAKEIYPSRIEEGVAESAPHNRVLYSYRSKSADNTSASVSLLSSSSSSFPSFPFPTGSLLTLQLRQSPGVAIDIWSARQRRLFEKNNDTTQTPLFEGIGVHYSYLWVGTPPQRVSVIIDTGSPHTAFPCVGCNCGQHMDPFFNPIKSSSATINECFGKKCFYKQSYSEGSSWSAFKVSDRLWMGGPARDNQPANVTRLHLNFDFGCMDHETGLFRTQNIDGIMGISAAASTLPFQLQKQGLTKSKAFALCMKEGGGVLTLGGVDPALHRPSNGALRIQTVSQGNLVYQSVDLAVIKLLRLRSLYMVRLLDVRMRSQHPNPRPESEGNASAHSRSVGVPMDFILAGKGAVVDSGSTDIYLPKIMERKFKSLFQELSGTLHHNNEVFLSPQQLDRLPVIIFRLAAIGRDSKTFVDVECPPSSYMASAGGRFDPVRKFTNGIFLTEDNSAVLGAAFMKDFNVIFDVDRRQLGLAKADCSYDHANLTPSSAHHHIDTIPEDNTNPTSNGNTFRGFDAATAKKKKKKKKKKQKKKKARSSNKKSFFIFGKALQ